MSIEHNIQTYSLAKGMRLDVARGIAELVAIVRVRIVQLIRFGPLLLDLQLGQ
jgi:hypothetical protein